MLTPIPYAEKFKFKEKFIERYSKLTNFEEFKRYSTSYLRRCIRVNTLKTTVKEVKSRLKDKWKLDQIPWCREGFYISGERTDIGNTIEHMLGYIYVQEAASMLPPMVLMPNKHEIVLDEAAAPGSKTTQLASMMENTGIIVANDVSYERIMPLTINLQRCGVSNAVVTLMHGKGIRHKFDKILLDAPCSGTGAIRKSLKTIEMWNPNAISRLASYQKGLLINAFDNLNEDGTLVYSTCSVEPEENEGVIDFLLKKRDCKLEEIKLDIKRSPVILEFEDEKYNEEIKKCLRIWPQDNDTEGFFVAKIRKN